MATRSGCHGTEGGAEDKHIRVWSLEGEDEGQSVAELPLHAEDGHWDVPSCIKWCPKTALFATGCHKTILWVPESEEKK